MNQFAQQTDAENAVRHVNGKPHAVAARRALGDIGNLSNGLGQQLQTGKDAAQGRTGVLTRRAAAQLAAASGANQGTDSWGTRPRQSLRPRDGNVPVVATAPTMAAQGPPKPARATNPIDDIDLAQKHDPLHAADFITHMHAFYQRTEPMVRVAEDYMSRQADINDKMRAILVDWLVDVHIKFKLMPETLFLTVNLIDRFLESKQVTRKHLQLVGVTAMLLASKYEEIWAPEVRDFVYISDRAYNRDQILHMEKHMLNSLKFNLTVPTIYHFVHRFMKAAGVTENAELIVYSMYLVELSLPDYSMLRFPYSMIAASAVSAACSVYGHDPMPHALLRISGYSEADLADCIDSLGGLFRRAPTASLTAVFKKYSSEKHFNVANHQAPPQRMDI